MVPYKRGWALCLLLITFCSLLVSFSSLCVTFCSSLVTFCLLLVSFYSLLVIFCLSLVTFCLLLVTFCSLLVTFCPAFMDNCLTITLIYLVDEVFIFSSLVLLKEMRTQGESKISSCCFSVSCKSKELEDRGSPRFPCVTPMVKSSSDLLQAIIS